LARGCDEGVDPISDRRYDRIERFDDLIRIVAGDVLAQRRAVDLAARSTLASRETLGSVEDIIGY